MSKIRGVFPLFLATAFGIFNGQCYSCVAPSLDLTALKIFTLGIVVFGPEFKKQGRAKLEQEQWASDLADTFVFLS